MFDQNLAIIAVAALLGAATLQVVLALAGYRARQRVPRTNQDLRDAQREIRSLHAALTALTRRLNALEQAPEPVVAVAAAPVRTETLDPAYDLAGKLARRGASAEELMETCGLSRGEVELIACLNSPAQSGAGAEGARSRALA